MNEDLLKLRTGSLVVIAIISLGILITANSEGWTSNYTVYLKPDKAPGVTVGTPIRKYGILIGRVGSVDGMEDHVRLGLKIHEKDKIYANEEMKIGTESFLGDAVINVLTLPTDERGALVGDGDVIKTVLVEPNPLEIVNLAMNLAPEIEKTLQVVQDAGLAVNDAGVGIKELTGTVQDVLGDEKSDFKLMLGEFRMMSQKAQVAIDNFNKIFENVNEIVDDPALKRDIKKSLAQLPRIFEEVRLTVKETRTTINSFKSITTNANKSLDNIAVFTGVLKENGPEVILQVKESLKNVKGLVDQIQKFTKSFSKITDSEGTINKLLNDTEIYDGVLETVNNVKDLSTKLEPMVNDLRMFADAVARDPGVLGARGALDRRPSKTGYKGTSGRDNGMGGFFR
jgi:phospholipid/cholesterol/gamma-HCH transport system substrate-binding protein